MIGTIKPQYNDIHFSGHESFPCRTLWLKKGYDFIKNNGNFNADDAVVTLGVGKNMVSAIRYWYKVFGFNSEKFGWIADYLFDNNNGKDKYLEDLATLWLLHFLIVYYNDATLYNVFFAMFQRERKVFDREHILNFVKRKLVEAQKETAFNENTVRRDIATLLLNYCLPKKPQSNDEYSTLLLDLDLIRQTDKTDKHDEQNNFDYYFNIEGKRKVTDEIFLFAVIVANEDNSQVIDYEILQEIGLIFCMTDLETIDMLKKLSEKYPEYLSYADHAGIRNLSILKELKPIEILNNYYDAKN
ncbi:MAG: DUF4007 family protein [Bacteroidales bacterium]|nr:DUF4007 family protein [Bacteroidales bacterium]